MKKAITLLMVLMQIVGLVSIAGADDDALQPYEQMALSIPEGYRLYGMDTMPDGTVVVLAEDEDGAYYFLRWKEPVSTPEVVSLSLSDILFVSVFRIAYDGEILVRIVEKPENPADDVTWDSACFVWLDAAGKETGRCTVNHDGYTIEALPGKRIAITGYDSDLVIYDETGGELSRVPSARIQSLFCDDTTLYAFDYDGIRTWSLETYEKASSYSLSGWFSGTPAFGPDGRLYITDQGGVFELLLEKGEAEKCMSGLGTAFGDPESFVNAFSVLPDGSFAMHIRNFSNRTNDDPYGSGSNTLAIYRPLENAESRTPFVISCMYANQLLMKAASEFQMQHPELDVRLREFNDRYSSGGMTRDDLLRRINTELLAGGGGDVLLVDYLPTKSMIARGMLRDLSGILSDVSLLPGIAEGAKHSDGKVYAIPAEFSVLLLWGREESISSIHTLTDIARAPIGPDQSRLSPYARETQFWQFFQACMPDFLDEQGKLSFDTEVFTEFLQTMYDIYSELDPPADLDYMVQYDNETIAMQNGNIAMHPEQLSGFFSLERYYSLFGQEEARAILMPSMRAPGAAYKSSMLLGIPSNAKDAALSESFIRLVFSEEMQIYAYYSSFSTVTANLDAMFADAIERSNDEQQRGRSFLVLSGGQEIELITPPEGFLTDMRALLDTVSVPAEVDDTIWGFVYEETEPFFNGSISAEAAARAIEQRAWLYMNE